MSFIVENRFESCVLMVSKTDTFVTFTFKKLEKKTVKPVYNDHPRDLGFGAVVDRWYLFIGSFMLLRHKLGL
jgi:hypothetical protein